jgi:formate dehydrogenase maturation protein FdhE
MSSIPSLVKIPSHHAATCHCCGGHRVTVLAMTLTDGTAVRFASCHHCEAKQWSRGGEAVPLSSVLNRSRKQH